VSLLWLRSAWKPSPRSLGRLSSWRKSEVAAFNIIFLPSYSLSRIGSELAGARYRPLFSSLAPDAASESLTVIASTHVTPDSGTGLVHCAPAHGAEDYNLFKEEGLISSTSSIVCHVGEGGLFTNEVAHVVGKEVGQTLVGQPVLDNGSQAIVGHLKNMNRLLKIERFKHRYPYDWKTDKPIIVTYVQILLVE